MGGFWRCGCGLIPTGAKERLEARLGLTAAISRDEGKTWINVRDIDNRRDRDAAYPSVTFVGDEALVAYYSRSRRWKRDAEITLSPPADTQACAPRSKKVVADSVRRWSRRLAGQERGLYDLDADIGDSSHAACEATR